MSHNSKHIINKQILELHLSEKTEAFAVQQKVAALCNDTFTHIISETLDTFFKNTTEHIQIENINIDLGIVNLKNITEIFSQELHRTLAEISKNYNTKDELIVQEKNIEKTPFKIISYYLMNGILPWWGTNSKAYLSKQLHLLLTHPKADFITMLVQLQQQPQYLKRYINTFSEAHVLQSAQLLTNWEAKSIIQQKEKITTTVKVKAAKASKNISETQLIKLFYTTLFEEFTTNETLETCANGILASMCHTLAIEISDIKIQQAQKEVLRIRSLIKSCQNEQVHNVVWQKVFKHAQQVVRKPSIHQMPIALVNQLKELLEEIVVKEKNTATKTTTENTRSQEKITTEILQPLIKHFTVLEKATKEKITKQRTTNTPQETKFKSVVSEFDATDFISIQNAGLVILWPFLKRFFENLNLLEKASFKNEEAKQKAVSILHYLCNEDESEIFEGVLPLAKIICGISIKEPVEIHTLSEADKEIANNFLNAIIQQGKSWGNISINGFRTSYLQRQASLRVRDDHWLLQVQKETYDVVLQKLPWSFNTVKLPWMEKLLIVEWLH